MPTPTGSSNVTTQPQKASLKPKVLLMCKDPIDAARWSTLVTSPSCTVTTCSNFLELLLYLEHETFQLVMILEGKTSAPGWRIAAEYIAESAQGTPFFIINRDGEASGLSPESGNLN
jgi:hypothetical protein